MGRVSRWAAGLLPLVLAAPYSRSNPNLLEFRDCGTGIAAACRNGGSRELAIGPYRPARSCVEIERHGPAEIAGQFGAKAAVPFNAGRLLYGWPERPGLYCDLLRARGLGLSAACLWDRDLDGRFEEATRLDFNSGSGDILGIMPSRKIIGVRFTKVRVMLPAPIAYVNSEPDPSVTGKILLYWEKAPKKGPPIENLYLGTPDNYTGTEGLSNQVLAFRGDRLPMDVDLFGLQVHLLGHDGRGLTIRPARNNKGHASRWSFADTHPHHRLLTPLRCSSALQHLVNQRPQIGETRT